MHEFARVESERCGGSCDSHTHGMLSHIHTHTYRLCFPCSLSSTEKHSDEMKMRMANHNSSFSFYPFNKMPSHQNVCTKDKSECAASFGFACRWCTCYKCALAPSLSPSPSLVTPANPVHFTFSQDVWPLIVLVGSVFQATALVSRSSVDAFAHNQQEFLHLHLV